MNHVRRIARIHYVASKLLLSVGLTACLTPQLMASGANPENSGLMSAFGHGKTARIAANFMPKLSQKIPQIDDVPAYPGKEAHLHGCAKQFLQADGGTTFSFQLAVKEKPSDVIHWYESSLAKYGWSVGVSGLKSTSKVWAQKGFSDLVKGNLGRNRNLETLQISTLPVHAEKFTTVVNIWYRIARLG